MDATTGHLNLHTPRWSACATTQILVILILALIGLPSVAVAQTEADGDAGVVILRWPAPGDDGTEGQATWYDVRYQPAHRGPLDTESEWDAATSAPLPPKPSPAGYRDSALVTGLLAGESYYFAVRTYDEAANESPISNTVLKTAWVQVCCAGRVGDVNRSGGDEPTISDIAALVDHLFVTRSVLWCVAEADINQSGGPSPGQGVRSDITIADVAGLIDYLFLGGPELPACY